VERWERRERKQRSKRKQMPKHGRSILILVRILVEKKENRK